MGEGNAIMKRTHTLLSAGGLALVLALAACVGTTEPTSTIKGLGIVPATAVIAVGGTQQFTAIMTPADLVPGGLSAISWSSSATSVATVSNAGVVTGVSAGVATINIVAGQYHAAASVRVFAP